MKLIKGTTTRTRRGDKQHQGLSLKGDVATVISVGRIRHSTSERVAERDKHFPSADFQTKTVNAALNVFGE